ncbi:MAG: MotA/TolQ/ExbB proton channel family protein [Longimicrobiales bacterium]|nr:MotA/TolQ/ExbB proton channel family protein [Longimicrobiales bacterium]
MAQYELLTLFADGGLMMYPLVLCSLVALGVIIAKAWTLWVAHKGTHDLLEEVEAAARAGDINGAMQVAAETPGPTAAILLAGLRRIRQGKVRRGEVDQAISTTGTIELGFLERGLVILATIANVAPLMGFLGTVAGMILAFDAIARAGDVDPSLVAGGIKVALLTTAAGLVIAVPVNIGYNFFVTRIDTLILDMEQGSQKVLALAWDFEKDGTLQVMDEKLRAQPLPARRPRSAPQAPPTESAPDDGFGSGA